MRKDSPAAENAPPQAAPDGRLDSWKEIAAYLKREVRTVQRWEKAEGLPVYRHMHGQLGSVYAFKSEIDTWWNNGHSRLEKNEPDVHPETSRRMHRWWLGGLAAGAALFAAAAVGLRTTLRPPLVFGQRDWVLVANFENRTGEPVLDGTLEYALERELSNSQFVNVAPRERVRDALRMMKKPLDSRMDGTLGREVCLRDGGIRALITGRVEKLGETYVLSAVIVNPENGAEVAGLSQEARGHDGILRAMRELSNQMRQTLGEKLPSIPESNQKLEKVTTPSLRALQLYSQGMALVNERKWAQAADWLEQSVREDPQFASAHILLAHCYSNLDRDQEAAPHYQRAFELANTTTDRERYFILGSYYQRFARDQEKAIQAYEILIQLYPEDYWGTNNLIPLYRATGRAQKTILTSVRLAKLRPNDYWTNAQAAVSLLVSGGSSAQARPFVNRARALMSADTLNQSPLDASWLEFFPAIPYWEQDDAQKVLSELRPFTLTASSLVGKSQDAFAENLGWTYLTLGRLREFEKLIDGISRAEDRDYFLAVLALVRNDREALRRYSGRLGGPSLLGTPVPVMLMARAGLLDQARKAARQRAAEFGVNSGWSKTIEGDLALAQGQPAKVLPLLQEGVASLRNSGSITFFLGSESLANAAELSGNLPLAIETLEEASNEKSSAGLLMGWAWMRDEWRLAQLYRKMGRKADAEKIETRLLKLLACADSDYPILAKLNHSPLPPRAAPVRPVVGNRLVRKRNFALQAPACRLAASCAPSGWSQPAL